MREEVICPYCGKEFEAYLWESGECLFCGKPYIWDSYLLENNEEWCFITKL